MKGLIHVKNHPPRVENKDKNVPVGMNQPNPDPKDRTKRCQTNELTNRAL